MRKVSISIEALCRLYGDKEALNMAKRMGADAVDFCTTTPNYDYRDPNSIYSKSEDEIASHFEALRRHADSLGLEIGQTHGRIHGFKNIKEEDDALIRNARYDFLAAKMLGAPFVIIHSTSSIRMGPDAPAELMHALNFDLFNRMIPYAKEFGVKIASETFGDAVLFNSCDFFGNIKEFTKSYDAICAVGDNAEYMSCCVDTGHSNKATRFGNPSPADCIRILGKNISTLHLNDNDTFTDQHKTPMTGCIDWNDVFDALDEVGYSGNYNMELNLCHFGEDFAYETAEFSVKLMRRLLERRYGKQ
jgi:sugar phosphate isomerase/epimerase